MPKLLRPYIPLEVRCRVVLRQLGEMFIDDVLAAHKGRLPALLRVKLNELASLLGCTAQDLRLDHDPALGARQKIFNEAGEHVDYIPAANDPEFLIYREKHAHHIKTNVRGDGAQHPDRVLIKRNRQMERPPKPKPKRAWPKRQLQSGSNWPKGRKIPTRRKP